MRTGLRWKAWEDVPMALGVVEHVVRIMGLTLRCMRAHVSTPASPLAYSGYWCITRDFNCFLSLNFVCLRMY